MSKRSELEGLFINISLTANGKPVTDNSAFNGTPPKIIQEKFKQAGLYSGVSRVLESGRLKRYMTSPRDKPLRGAVELTEDTPTLKLEDGTSYKIETNCTDVYIREM
jgi:hypothetical protein